MDHVLFAKSQGFYSTVLSCMGIKGQTVLTLVYGWADLRLCCVHCYSSSMSCKDPDIFARVSCLL